MDFYLTVTRKATTPRIITLNVEIIPQEVQDVLFSDTKANLSLKSEHNEWTYLIFFTKLLFPLQPFFCRLSWLRHYLEFRTLCVNIAYNVTLNMQLWTAQHLISHLSVTVPSVGSPAAPVRCRGKGPTKPGRGGSANNNKRNCERERRGGEVKTLTCMCLVTEAQLFKAHLISVENGKGQVEYIVLWRKTTVQ